MRHRQSESALRYQHRKHDWKNDDFPEPQGLFSAAVFLHPLHRQFAKNRRQTAFGVDRPRYVVAIKHTTGLDERQIAIRRVAELLIAQ